MPRSTTLPLAVACAVTLTAVTAGAGPGDRAGRLVRVDAPAPTRAWVGPGSFIMGTQPEDLETLLDECRRVESLRFAQGDDVCVLWINALVSRAPREVWLDGYWIDRREVTSDEYRGCVHDGACPLDPLVEGDPRYQSPGLPMVNVQRAEAETFCRWRGGRLPTEAEWEKAARGADARTWPWGNTGRPESFNHGQARIAALLDLERVISELQLPARSVGDVDDSDGYAQAAPPGSLRGSDGPYGMSDQAGNVAEWVADASSTDGLLHQPSRNPVRDPDLGIDTPMTRGGSWRDPPFMGRVDLPHYLSPAMRATVRLPYLGFRCAYASTVLSHWHGTSNR